MNTTKTTLEMPDALFRRAKAAAATRGQSLKQMVIRALERDLQEHAPSRRLNVSSTMRSIRTVAAANAARWKSKIDSVEAVREQRR